MKTITINQLKDLLATVNHATPVSFTCLTDAKARKTDNPFAAKGQSIHKWTKVNAFTGCIYANAMEKARSIKIGTSGQLPSAPAYQAQPRAWGERVSAALVKNENNGRYYLPVHVNHTREPLYLVNTGTKLKLVAKELVSPYLPEAKASLVTRRDYALDSIKSICFNGRQYRVRS